jgi:hypothetical protein
MFDRRRFLLLAAGGAWAQTDGLNGLAERYVKLVLALGQHDADYVDAYYGPPAWNDEAARRKLPLADIQREAAAVVDELSKWLRLPGDELVALRRRYLSVQAKSLIHRAEMLGGQRFTFDEESRALYDAVAPPRSEHDFRKPLETMDRLIPGTGPLAERYAEWQKRFEIPPDRLDMVFRAALDEARTRTKRHIRLPVNEAFDVEYVNGQVWSAYNWYKGGAHSLIQVNTDRPVEINSAIRLACHEGYPGHHVYNALLEDRLVRGRGWIEYSVYALYSPQSLIAEGSADYGVGLVFPPAERIAFLENVMFPRAGLKAAEARRYYEVQRAAESLDHAVNTAARRYLDGQITREQCQKFLEEYALKPPGAAAQQVRFIEKNRSYVINYNLGEDLIRAYLEKRGSGWSEFERLLSSPRLPSDLA